MKTLVTHNGGFHSDDIIAYAILQEYLSKNNETWTITRTRDREIINAGDIVFDVGEIYDPTTNRYDHHQTGRAGARPNGILYASAGLVWKYFGRDLCASDKVWDDIDKFLICPIDAMDNGQDLIKELNFSDTGVGSIGPFLSSFEPTIYEDKSAESLLVAFEAAAAFTRTLLNKVIHFQNALDRATRDAFVWYEQSTDKQVLIFERNFERPVWIRLSEFPEPLFVIYPETRQGTWKAETVRKHPVTFEARIPFPESWAGLRDTELQEVSGVSDAQFCHPGRFLCGAGSQEGTIALVKRARELYEQSLSS